MKIYDIKISIIMEAEDKAMARMKAEDVIDNTDYQYLIHEIEDITEESE